MIKLVMIEDNIYDNLLYVEDENESLLLILKITDDQVNALVQLHMRGKLHLRRYRERP